MEYPWYEVISKKSEKNNDLTLEQGDIFLKYPVLIPKVTPQDIEKLHKKQDVTIETDVNILDIIVMSQSCDLGQNNVNEVILCSWTPIDMHALSKNQKNQIKEISKGKKHNQHLLKDETELKHPFGIVDFTKIYTTPKSGLTLVAEALDTRVRLLPPYREHLSQAFARYFMRVGLPVPTGI